MKRVYLVRHGETTSNLKQTWRTANEDLTDHGIQQARALAQRVTTLSVQSIVSSTAKRTMDTAQIIADKTGLTLEGNELFYEEKTPTSIQGLIHEKTPDNPIEKYIQSLLAHSEEPDYHYEDEENLYERKVRIQKILSYLEHADDHTLIITHGNILKMLVAYIILGPDCTAKELYLCSQRLKTSNTGITLLEYVADQWRILIWNDHAHFAE